MSVLVGSAPAPTTSSSAAPACSTRPRASTRSLDVRVDGGDDRRSSAPALDANGHRVIDGAGLVLAPAFVDPHVHLRTPGREDEETIASGTAAAAAGGYCAILAMPNTDPVVDSAAVLAALSSPRRRRGRGAGRLHWPRSRWASRARS